MTFVHQMWSAAGWAGFPPAAGVEAPAGLGASWLKWANECDLPSCGLEASPEFLTAAPLEYDTDVPGDAAYCSAACRDDHARLVADRRRHRAVPR